MTDPPKPAARPVILPNHVIVQIKRVAEIRIATLMLSYPDPAAPLMSAEYVPDVLRVFPVTLGSLPAVQMPLQREVSAVFVNDDDEQLLPDELLNTMAALMDEDAHVHALFPAPESWLAVARQLGFVQLWATAPHEGDVIASRACLAAYPDGALTFDSGRKLIRVPFTGDFDFDLGTDDLLSVLLMQLTPIDRAAH